mmetsp:Transcript_4161/g.10700  ORF Transcript_4161/g.10700 Transcript_4161/m.10700 type:complete len:483 (+) Transcript_4161:168-1616(+)|eukprot:jgi/Tetstr1/447104/TSEL_034542.t1
MDPHSTASGMRVLLGAESNVCSATSKVLRSIGYAVTTCSSQNKLLDLLSNQSFDIVLAEAKSLSSSSDSVDGLQLLGKDASPPVIVAMSLSDQAAVDDALKRGASDVIDLPMSKQQGKLELLWQHALWKNGGSASCTTSSMSSGGGHLDLSDLVSQESQHDDINIDELLLHPLDCDTYSHYQCPTESADEMVEDCFKLVVSSNFLSSTTPELMEPAAACLPTVEGAEQGAPVLVAVDKRPLSMMQTLETAPAMEGMLGQGSAADSGSPEDRKGKRAKVEWTDELHEKFVQAVETLGQEKAVPSRILEHMGVTGSGLTRQNIASHLQKYRSRKTRSRKGLRTAGAATSSKPATRPNGAGTAVHALMQPNGSMPMMQVPTNGLQIVSGMPVHSNGAGQQQWVQMWGALPQGAVLCNHLGQPLMQHPPRVISSTAPAFPSGPSAVDIQKAIKDVLNKPKAKGALGLLLDARGIAEGLKVSATAAA